MTSLKKTADATEAPRLQTAPKPLSERKQEEIETIATTIRDQGIELFSSN